jgi:putative tricarboxylic transport membrane protein
MEMLGYAADVFTLGTLAAMMIGVFAGMVIGALPGLTANLGVALLLPITFSMDVTAALVMLMSLYTTAIYAGSFPAILLHTPGTSASAATAIDGFVLTQRGEFNKALRVATFSSVFGGVASALALLLIAPPLSLLSLRFGPAEYLMLAVFGLTIIGTLASGNMVKGLLAGALGLLLSTVGLDLDTGFPRYAFGISDLASGISFVPVVIGLFSVSQAFLMCEDAQSKIQRVDLATPERWRFFPTWAEIHSLRYTLGRSSIIGVFVGILPGAGADVGSWVAYNEARRFSKNKEEFGNGSIHGISASESANNAVTGSSLVPLLTLGIPGSATAALLLGALIVHGLVPGRTLFTDNAEITYTVIFAFLLANIVMGFVGMSIGRYMSLITGLPNAVLIPVILMLSVVGAYSLGNNMFDVYTMLAAGVVGYAMRKAGFSPAPLILGLILGPIAETGYRQSLTLSGGDVVTYVLSQPIALVITILTVLSLASAVILEFRTRRSVGQK